MLFVLGSKDLLLKSKFYKSEKNLNYPLKELDHVINENTNNNMIYVVADDKRIYETSCKKEDLQKLYRDLKQEIKLRRFEMAALSLCIKYYIKAGIDIANTKLQEWKEINSDVNPNIDEVLKNFKTIIEPIETYKNKKKNLDVKITEEASKIVTIFERDDYKKIEVKAIEDLTTLKKANIKDLENEGKFIVMQFEEVEEDYINDFNNQEEEEEM